MPDNTGNYTSRAKFLLGFADAGNATKNRATLSAKTPLTLPAASFNAVFNPTVTPAVGWWVVQGDKSAQITAVAGPVITLDTGNDLSNGVGWLLQTDLSVEEIDAFIAEAMAFIDRHTRQFFNKRTFSGADALVIEGNNSDTMFFQVPIIEITSMKVNDRSEAVDMNAIKVFSSRQGPNDDRRNPKIKLKRDLIDDVIFTSAGVFLRGAFTTIEGSFGFLEPDGSTPLLIQKATAKYAVLKATDTLGESVASSATGTGAIKREKTDLHEIEYFDPDTASKQSINAGSGLSGDDEIDDIIASYKSPILIGGSFPDFGVEAPTFAGGFTDNRRRT